MMKAAIFDFNRTLYDPEQEYVYKEALPLLQFLKKQGWKLALLSIGTEEREKQLEPLRLFFDIISIVEIKTREAFVQIQRNFRLPAKDIIVIGDRIKREITLGKQLGMKTIWIRQGNFSEEGPLTAAEKPDYTFSSLSALGTFLNQNILRGK